MSIGLALAGLAGATFSGGAATADLRASGLEDVALVDIPAVTHFDWFTRTIDGSEHTIAMVGSRDLTAKSPQIDQTPAGGLNLVDVTDPENPEFLLNVFCPTTNNDVAYIDVQHTIGGIAYDGFILLASNDSTGCAIQNGLQPGGVSIVGLKVTPDAGDAISATWFRSPFLNVPPATGRFSWSARDPAAHTVVAHPTRPIAYVGNQNLADRTPSVEILDLSMWPPQGRSFTLIAAPTPAGPPAAILNGSGPHDITFAPDGTRAYASNITASFIWDISGDKVFAPETLSTLISPNLKIHHETVRHPNGRHLLTVDEFVATSNENIPVCPGGALHVFDTGPLLEDGTRAFERAPVPVGQFYADEIGTLVPFGVDPAGPSVHLETSCTAHEFSIPAAGDWMPLAWFGVGVRILDLSMLADPAVIAAPNPTPIVIDEIGFHVPEGTDTWAAKTHPNVPGYVFATDTSHGFRILRRI
jgi:hypothetical protein